MEEALSALPCLSAEALGHGLASTVIVRLGEDTAEFERHFDELLKVSERWLPGEEVLHAHKFAFREEAFLLFRCSGLLFFARGREEAPRGCSVPAFFSFQISFRRRQTPCSEQSRVAASSSLESLKALPPGRLGYRTQSHSQQTHFG